MRSLATRGAALTPWRPQRPTFAWHLAAHARNNVFSLRVVNHARTETVSNARAGAHTLTASAFRRALRPLAPQRPFGGQFGVNARTDRAAAFERFGQIRQAPFRSDRWRPPRTLKLLNVVDRIRLAREQQLLHQPLVPAASLHFAHFRRVEHKHCVDFFVLGRRRHAIQLGGRSRTSGRLGVSGKEGILVRNAHLLK